MSQRPLWPKQLDKQPTSDLFTVLNSGLLFCTIRLWLSLCHDPNPNPNPSQKLRTTTFTFEPAWTRMPNSYVTGHYRSCQNSGATLLLPLNFAKC